MEETSMLAKGIFNLVSLQAVPLSCACVQGLCVRDGLLFAVDKINHCVAVFAAEDGRLVASLRSSAAAQRRPFSACVSDASVLYQNAPSAHLPSQCSGRVPTSPSRCARVRRVPARAPYCRCISDDGVLYVNEGELPGDEY